jgi:hypothetical protein
MDKHRITRPTRSDERACDREVHGHQEPGGKSGGRAGEGGRSYLGRSALCLSNGTEGIVRCADGSAEVSRGHSGRRVTAGSDGCVPSPGSNGSNGSNGSVETLVLQSCDAAASAGIWRRKPPAAHMAIGGSQAAPRLPSRCQPPSSPHSAWLRSRESTMPNPLNRRIRTRMPWWCGRGGVARRPLSRFQVFSGFLIRCDQSVEASRSAARRLALLR